MTEIPPPRLLGRNTAVDVTIVIALMGGAWWLFQTTNAVREQILPEISAMKVTMQHMATEVTRMGTKIDGLPSNSGVRAIISDQLKPLEERVRMVEDRVRDLEHRSK